MFTVAVERTKYLEDHFGRFETEQEAQASADNILALWDDVRDDLAKFKPLSVTVKETK